MLTSGGAYTWTLTALTRVGFATPCTVSASIASTPPGGTTVTRLRPTGVVVRSVSAPDATANAPCEPPWSCGATEDPGPHTITQTSWSAALRTRAYRRVPGAASYPNASRAIDSAASHA